MSNLKAIKRDSTSSGSNNKLRSEGLIPAILYGGKTPNQNIYFDVQGRNRVDAIIRFEELVTDLRDLADQLGLQSLKNRIEAGEMPSLKQRSSKPTRLKTSDYFTEAALSAVNKKYQRWFVAGNYPEASSMDELIG